MNKIWQFNRMEVAGSLGDLGTLLPISLGMILANGLDPTGTFLSIGLFYIFSGIYYKVTVPVQPMKVIGAYAIATGMTATQISASAFLVGCFLLIIGGTSTITRMGKYIAKPVVRGVQLSTGILLMAEGVRFMVGTSKFQILKASAEPWLSIQHLGPIPIGIILGLAGGILTLLFLENKKLPAGLLVIMGGLLVGLMLKNINISDSLSPGFHLPSFLPAGFPSQVDFTFALMALVLPQIPMTLGNAVIAYADLSQDYFGEKSKKVTHKAACISMALANFMSFFMGGIPLCHGAGGLAAHYRFGARSPGSNLIIGGVFVILTLFLGPGLILILHLIPMSILGVLLIFAGGQLALTIMDLKERKELFVPMIIMGITLASNLAAGFMVGIIIHWILTSEKMSI
ncbi:sulfate permease, SulP family [Desulfocicer vacuolatum DSM 3385]|uniref:Sulfate permease, SulP family n=1 Tax=Desulfocicer vacuolatum DSM 3385 TaxID=1121400 RepID=A0A1W2A3E2_9BACT|nr:putative sulfate/molybdate transporter [Desulfocicer vacuolatum]SMC55184.1 sulfate permease, SulP family [Desulfocicer vacuolatum DSM 3385]